jgi:hypothetical protein
MCYRSKEVRRVRCLLPVTGSVDLFTVSTSCGWIGVCIHPGHPPTMSSYVVWTTAPLARLRLSRSQWPGRTRLIRIPEKIP